MLLHACVLFHTVSIIPLLPSGTIPQYHMDKQFADRRYKVQSARTYFYLNEAQCERNLEIFHECLEAVSGKSKAHHVFVTSQSGCVSTQRSGLLTSSHIVFGHLPFILEMQAFARVCVDQRDRCVMLCVWTKG